MIGNLIFFHDAFCGVTIVFAGRTANCHQGEQQCFGSTVPTQDAIIVANEGLVWDSLKKNVIFVVVTVAGWGG